MSKFGKLSEEDMQLMRDEQERLQEQEPLQEQQQAGSDDWEQRFDDWEQRFVARRAQEKAENAAELPALCERLAALGITSVEAEFAGCGDSGEFEDITYDPEVKVPEDLASDLDDWLCGALPDGWEVDDGASGMITIDVPAKTAHVSIDFNVVTTENDSWDIG